MQVIVNSLLTSYQDTGKGKTLLVLHGWGDSAAGLRPFIMALSKIGRVVAVDLPGFGGTQAPWADWSLNDYADFLQAFIAKTGLKVDVIIGHSNGGAIAIRAIARGVETKRLVLVASAGIRSEYKGRKKALRLAAKTGKIVMTPLPASIQKKLRRLLYTTIGSDLLVAEHLQGTFKLVVEDDVQADATKVYVPTLLIYGDKDVSAPLRYGKKLQAAIKGSKLIVIPGGEHMLPTDNTSQVVGDIKDFLK